MIFHIPHSCTNIPEKYQGLFVLGRKEIAEEISLMTDHHTEALFSSLGRNGDTVITSPVSRLLVDMERFEDDVFEKMADIGLGVVYTKTADGRELKKVSKESREKLLNEFYHPHHKRLTKAVFSELYRRGRAIIFDCHSFPSEPFSFESCDAVRPDICLGFEAYHAPAGLVDVLRVQCEISGYTVAINSPFSGSIVPAHFWRHDGNVVSIMIEINRSLYMDEKTLSIIADRFKEIQRLLGSLVDIAKEQTAVMNIQNIPQQKVQMGHQGLRRQY